jgi:hypothetical protein
MLGAPSIPKTSLAGGLWLALAGKSFGEIKRKGVLREAICRYLNALMICLVRGKPREPELKL